MADGGASAGKGGPREFAHDALSEHRCRNIGLLKQTEFIHTENNNV